MSRNVFSCQGGDKLTSMGASWFVSYCYYENIDPNHQNWNYGDIATRKSVYSNSRQYHKYWLSEVLTMNDGLLSTNQIQLSPAQIKQMAKELLAKL